MKNEEYCGKHIQEADEPDFEPWLDINDPLPCELIFRNDKMFIQRILQNYSLQEIIFDLTFLYFLNVKQIYNNSQYI